MRGRCHAPPVRDAMAERRQSEIAMKRIWLENYRCFRARQEAYLAPLTLLVGENSTGKTSFLAMIRALWEVAYRNRVPDFKEEPYDLGSFHDVAHFRGGRSRRATSFEAGFERRGRPNKSGARCWTMTFSKEHTAPFPARRRFSNKDGSLWAEERFRETPNLRFGRGRKVWNHNADIYAPEGVDDDRYLPVLVFLSRDKRDRALTQEMALPEDDDRDIGKLIGSALRAARDSRPVYAGGPVRSKPRRTYDPTRIGRDAEGDYVPMFLADLYFNSRKRWEGLQGALERFGKDAGLFDEIVVKPFGRESGPFQLQVRRFDGRSRGPYRNLVDVGYGVSQVLPFVTELLRDDAPQLALLQQPEVHLHPSAQAALGSLFGRLAASGSQLVVETQSDHLLNRVRMDVRDGVSGLRSEDVSLVYFERRDLDVTIHSLRFDQEGNVLGAPPGYNRFFMEEVARSLHKQRRAGSDVRDR